MATKRVSLREIARRCGLSPTTVSRIVKGTGSFSDETRRLVFETMEAAGYQPRSLSVPSAQAAGAGAMVGCMVSDYTNEVFADRLAIMDRFFTEWGVLFLTCETHRDPELERAHAQRFVDLGARGLIVSGAGVGIMEAVPAVPTIFMDIRSNQLAEHPNAYLVTPDDEVGGQLAAQELICKGCRKPLVLNIRHTPARANERIMGFVHNYAEHGITVGEDRILEADDDKSSFESAKDLVAYHWAKKTDFDAVFACSDWRAYGALIGLKNLGVSVPETIKIVGYDGISMSRYCETPLTTIRQNTEQLALTTCDTLWRLMQGDRTPPHQQLVPVHVQDGKTT